MKNMLILLVLVLMISCSDTSIEDRIDNQNKKEVYWVVKEVMYYNESDNYYRIYGRKGAINIIIKKDAYNVGDTLVLIKK